MQALLYMVSFTAFTWLVVTVQNRRRLLAVTLVGVMVVATVTSARFRAAKTAAGAWTLYRLS